MKKQLFSGTGVALVTPFDQQGQINFDALEKLIEYTIEGGVDFIISLGTTGEAITLSGEECRKILDFTIQVVNQRVPIVAGHFGGNNTKVLSEKIKEYDFDGIDGILSSSPAYSKPSQEGIFQHYMKLAEVSPKPIIIYNVPGRTSSNISATTILRLANASKKFVGVKDASGDLVQGAQLIKNKPDHFLVLSGDDPTCLPLLSCGGDGVISVISNAFPQAFSQMVRTARQGNFAEASQLHLALLDVHQWLYVEGNPSGIKAALEILNITSKDVRLPLTSLQERNYLSLKKEINTALNHLKKNEKIHQAIIS